MNITMTNQGNKGSTAIVMQQETELITITIAS